MGGTAGREHKLVKLHPPSIAAMNRFASPAALFRDATEACRKVRGAVETREPALLMALLRESLPAIERPIAAVSFSTETSAACGLVLGGRYVAVAWVLKSRRMPG